jgi:hypothetical protein
MYITFVIVMPLSFVLLGAMTLYVAFTQNGPVWFGVVWSILVLYGGYQSLSMPHRIEVTESGEIRFIGIRTTTVLSHNVVSIRQSLGFIELKHREGRLKLLGQFAGFHEFLTDLKCANPSVDIRGC